MASVGEWITSIGLPEAEAAAYKAKLEEGCVDAETMDEARIRAEIEGALLTDEEFEGFMKGVALTPAELPNPFAKVPRCVKI